MGEIICGISDDYLGNVALLEDGRPLFAMANERLSRKKGDAGFPHLALNAALDHAGLTLDRVDQIVVANRSHFVYRLLHKRFQDYTHDFFSPEQKGYLKFHDLMHGAPRLVQLLEQVNRKLLRGKVGRRVRLCDHHLAHALSGVLTAGFRRCLVASIDNLGDGFSTKVHSFDQGKMQLLHGCRASSSPGQFYGEVTQLLGYNPLRHAGKVTGLAAHGDPGPAYPWMEQLIRLSDDGRTFQLLPSFKRFRRHGLYFRLSLFAPEDVAAAAQKRLEDLVCAHVGKALKDSGHDRLVLTGGVASNVKLNLELSRLPGLREVHVHPAMSDEGLAMGAAALPLLERGTLVEQELKTAYLGPCYSDGEVRAALGRSPLRFRAARDPAQAAAELLARGYVVCRFCGRLEYGPRALGNRSILYRADDPQVNTWLNRKLHRTEFMPFAPMVRWEDADACFEELDRTRACARFMTIALPCTPSMKQRCPGVVHVDGTARPQLVRREDNAELHRLLGEYTRRSGLPALINTSFNLHDEPIVCTPDDAIRTFCKADLDVLMMEDQLVWDPARADLPSVIDDVCSRDQ